MNEEDASIDAVEVPHRGSLPDANPGARLDVFAAAASEQGPTSLAAGSRESVDAAAHLVPSAVARGQDIDTATAIAGAVSRIATTL